MLEKSDRRGGSGANFIVNGSAKDSITEPIVEAVHFYASGNPAFAFVGRSRVIEGVADEPAPE